MENTAIFTQYHRINTTMVNINQRLGLFGLLGLLQDAAVEHANSLGLSHQNLLEKGFFWVLIQQRLRMTRYPRWNETICIKTWAKSINGIYAVREYEIFLGDEKIGECATTWMILDSQTHKPKRLSQAAHSFITHASDSMTLQTEKIQLPELTYINTLTVKISDLDINQHVSNTKYAQWMLDTIPVDYHRQYIVKEYSINFAGETFLGDTIDCLSSQSHPDFSPNERVYFSGIRQSDGKAVFRAKLVSQQIGQ